MKPLCTVLATALTFGAVTTGPALLGASPAAHAQQSAGDHFDAGVGLFKDGDYMAAMIEFKKAYELDPNFHVLYNLGQTSRELRQYAEALSWFRDYLEQGGAKVSESRRAEVEGWIEELEGRVGTVTLTVNVPGAEVAVDDIAVGTTPLDEPLVLSAGRRKIALTKSGYAPLTRFVDVAGREEKTLELELVSLEQPAPAPTSTPAPGPVPAPAPVAGDDGFSAAPWVLLGSTVAVGIGAAVVGGIGLGAKGDFDEALETVPNSADDIDSARSSARTLAITADVLMGVAAALGVTTIIVFAVEASDDGDETAEASPEVRLTAGPTGLGVMGAF